MDIFHLTQLLTEKFPSDPSTPGIIFSFIPRTKSFYVAVHRFSEPRGNGRSVEFKVSGTQAECEAALAEYVKTL